MPSRRPPMLRTPRGIRRFQRAILDWHRENRREFPWRRTREPYEVLVAEMLLQQTDAAKVLGVYERFLEQFPSLRELAAASPDELSCPLGAIGLFYRAGRLSRIARRILDEHGGIVPASEEALVRLPGIGRYIARSICAAAFGQKKGVLDTNVIRILDRCFGVTPKRRRAREDRDLWDLVDRLVPPSTMAEPAEWNWALLDFAAVRCTYHNPQCSSCDLSTAGCRKGGSSSA